MSSTALDAVTIGAGVVGAVVAAPKWLRVAQREHYLSGSTTRFAIRWWTITPLNIALLVAAVVAVSLGSLFSPVAIVGAVIVALAPIGLSLRGRTSKLAWTKRLKTLAAVAGAVFLILALPFAVDIKAAGASGAAGVCGLGVFVPLLIDLGLFATSPLERWRLGPFLRQARARLDQVRPQVVAITGSYGKTSTKGYVSHLVSAAHSVLPTPRSFNNIAGLSRSINQHLAPGTDVFVAEMGTYGPGEIARLCDLVAPDIAIICAIGPVHLERMGSEENIVRAKSEILEKASVAILNVDHPLLAELAEVCALQGKKVWRVTSQLGGPGADNTVAVSIDGGELKAVLPDGEVLTASGVHAPPTNVACAIASALELGVTPAQIGARLGSLPTADHRLTVTTGSAGQQIIDDTYNANPAGGRAALALLSELGNSTSKRVVVTPGMIELGKRQADENAAFATAAGDVASHLVVVGKTNAKALKKGAQQTGLEVISVPDRPAAVEWVRVNAGSGDVVLYENDLPDHFP